MRKWLKRIALVLAIAFLVLSFVNASWLAPRPHGYPKLIAHRGVSQQFNHKGLGRDTCTATRIEPPLHPYLENTLAGMAQAEANGAKMIEVDVAPTADGRMVLFHDWTLDCRTNGKGEVRAATLAQLKALDAGYGYSADGGKSFPLRGKGMGLIPTVEDAARAFPDRPLLYNFKSKDAAEADLLAATLKAAGRDPQAVGDGFYGAEAPVARIRQLFPKAWAFSKEEGKACTMAYLKLGWLGITPAACRGGTLFVPLNYQWAFAGWPNRAIARMEAVGARVVIVGPHGEGLPIGLDLPEQVGRVPASFTGYIWVDDIRAVGPALHPALNKRNPVEEAELAKALEARRKSRE